MQERGWLLTGWLIYLILSNAWWAYRYYLTIDDYVRHHDPRYEAPLTWALPLLLGLALVNIVAALLMLLWRKVGFYIFLTIAIVAFVVNLIVGVEFTMMLVGLGGIVILWMLLQSRWQHFH